MRDFHKFRYETTFAVYYRDKTPMLLFHTMSGLTADKKTTLAGSPFLLEVDLAKQMAAKNISCCGSKRDDAVQIMPRCQSLKDSLNKDTVFNPTFNPTHERFLGPASVDTFKDRIGTWKAVSLWPHVGGYYQHGSHHWFQSVQIVTLTGSNRSNVEFPLQKVRDSEYLLQIGFTLKNCRGAIQQARGCLFRYPHKGINQQLSGKYQLHPNNNGYGYGNPVDGHAFFMVSAVSPDARILYLWNQLGVIMLTAVNTDLTWHLCQAKYSHLTWNQGNQKTHCADSHRRLWKSFMPCAHGTRPHCFLALVLPSTCWMWHPLSSVKSIRSWLKAWLGSR